MVESAERRSRDSSKSRGNGFYFVLCIWFFFQVYVASQRSLWHDEWFRVDQIRLPFFEAYYSMFRELPPYTLGELFLGQVSHFLFSSWLPLEVWSRIPSLLFSTATLYLIGRRRDPWFLILGVFSVALTAMSTQFRSYASLIFCGAVAGEWALSQKDEKQPHPLSFWIAAGLLLGHVYGLLFLSWVGFWRRSYRVWIFGLLYLGGIFVVKKWVGTDQHYPIPPLQPGTEILKQAFGALANPHKSILFYGPLFVWGLWRTVSLYGRQSGLLFASVLGGAVWGPIVADLAKPYFFLPRQVVGGVVPFLFCISLGLRGVTEWVQQNRFHSKMWRRGCALTGVFLLGLVLWWSSIRPWHDFIRGNPPFIDEPLHRFQQVRDVTQDRTGDVFVVVDYSYIGSIQRYLAGFSRLLRPGEPVVLPDAKAVSAAGVPWRRWTGPRGAIYFFLDDFLPPSVLVGSGSRAERWREILQELARREGKDLRGPFFTVVYGYDGAWDETLCGEVDCIRDY